MEVFAIAMYRCLPKQHPLHKLIQPHLMGVIPINVQVTHGSHPNQRSGSNSVSPYGLGDRECHILHKKMAGDCVEQTFALKV